MSQSGVHFPLTLMQLSLYVLSHHEHDCKLNYIHSAKKFLDTYKSSIFTKMLRIRQIESLLCEAGECPLHFDTKLEGIG